MFDANRVGDVGDVDEALTLAKSLANRVTGVEDYWLEYSVAPLAGIVCAVSPIGGGGGVDRARRIAASPQHWPAAADDCPHSLLSDRLRRVAGLEHRQRDSIKHVLVAALA